jgi:hypothetical protein
MRGVPARPITVVTLILKFGESSLMVENAIVRQRRGKLVARLVLDPIPVQYKNIECMIVHLRPVVAHPFVTGSGTRDRAVASAAP